MIHTVLMYMYSAVFRVWHDSIWSKFVYFASKPAGQEPVDSWQLLTVEQAHYQSSRIVKILSTSLSGVIVTACITLQMIVRVCQSPLKSKLIHLNAAESSNVLEYLIPPKRLREWSLPVVRRWEEGRISCLLGLRCAVWMNFTAMCCCDDIC